MALGSYPAVTVAAARKARDAAKISKGQGIDPVQARKLEKLKSANPDGDTFKAIALEWFKLQTPNWSASHATRTLRNLEKDLFPFIGAKLMTDIHPLELMAAVKKVEGLSSGAPPSGPGCARVRS